MLMDEEDRKEYRIVCLIMCLSLIVMWIVVSILIMFIRNPYIVAGIGIATFFGSCTLFCLLSKFEELRAIGIIRESKKEMRLKKLESKFYPAGAPRAPSKIGCHVCGATYEKLVNYCKNCGAKIITPIEDTEKDYY